MHRTACAPLQYRVEYRQEVAGRGIDDLQYLGGCGLLLQGLARLGDEPRVLHRDHRLRGEVLQQCYLFVGKWPNLLAVDREKPQQSTFVAQRYAEQRADSVLIDASSQQRIPG